MSAADEATDHTPALAAGAFVAGLVVGIVVGRRRG